MGVYPGEWCVKRVDAVHVSSKFGKYETTEKVAVLLMGSLRLRGGALGRSTGEHDEPKLSPPRHALLRYVSLVMISKYFLL